jgi:carbon monoxide dehydrogenase subunit G
MHSGLRGAHKNSDTELEAKVTLKVGPVKAKFGGKVTLDKSQAPGHFR